jgi:hypothetical protein
LEDGQAAGHQRDDQGDRGPREQPAEDPVRSVLGPDPLLDGSPLRLRPALRRVEELALDRAQFGIVAGGTPRARRGEACPAVEVTIVPPALGPIRGRVGQVAHRAQPLAVLVEPDAQARPLTDQCLVSDLHALVRHGHQAGGRQRLEHERRG